MESSKEIIELRPREKKIRLKLIEFAAAKRTIAYQSLSYIANLGLDMQYNEHVNELAEYLDRISKFELQEGRPLLSAIVINSTLKRQGDGFFKLCTDIEEDLKILLKCDVLSPSIDQQAKFSKVRIKDCWDFWSNNDNFKGHKGKDTHIK